MRGYNGKYKLLSMRAKQGPVTAAATYTCVYVLRCKVSRCYYAARVVLDKGLITPLYIGMSEGLKFCC